MRDADLPPGSPGDAAPGRRDAAPAPGEEATPLRVLVAGGTGFLGAAFVRLLHDRGHRVTVLSRSPESVPERFPDRRVDGRAGDITRPGTLRPALEGADVAIQSVQFPGFPVEDPARGRTFMDVDARGTENVAEAAVAAGVRRLLYLSGVGADPSSARAWYRAKGLAEAAVHATGLERVIVRPSWVYGPEDRSLNLFADLVRRVPLCFPQLGDGRQRLNPVFIDDVAGVVADAVERPDLREETLEIGGPVTYTMDGIVRIVMDTLGRRKPIVHVPLSLARAAAAGLEVLPGQILSRDAIRFLVQDAVADTSALHRRFPDLEPTPMPVALRRYLR